MAAIYARLTNKIHYLRASLEAQFDRPGLGREPAHNRLLQLREEAHVVLRANCERMLEVGQALVITADAYAATDQEAADAFYEELEAHRDAFDNPPVHVPTPPGPNDPIPTRGFR